MTIDRRSFLLGSGALAAALATTSACSSAGSSSNTADVNAAVTLPTFKAYAGSRADLPATAAGVDAGYQRFPSRHPRSVTERPGTGAEKLLGLANTYLPVPASPPQNAFWAGLNERLGVDLGLSMVPYTDYGAKFATTVAGDDLPDFLQMRSVPRLPDLLAAKFQDLTEHLSGDAVLDYPNLANLPTRAWKSTVYNGHLCGIPIPRGALGGAIFTRDDLLTRAGVAAQPKSYEEFVAGCRAVTDAKSRRWAFSTVDGMSSVIAPMAGEPNTWRLTDRKLVHAVETDEHRRTVSTLTELWAAGVVNPDGFGTPNLTQLFAGGSSVYTTGGYLAWSQLVTDSAENDDFELGLMRIPTWDGGGLAPWMLGSGSFSFTALKKAAPDRIALQLRVLDWLAAPFGTEEYFYRIFGTEGQHHTLSADGDPRLTAAGTRDTGIPIRYLADSPAVLYQPGRPQDAATQHAYQSDEIPVGVANPTLGLFSDAAAEKLPTITKALQDGTNQIIQGRRPLADLDGLLDAWRGGGGDTMRQEYEAQL